MRRLLLLPLVLLAAACGSGEDEPAAPPPPPPTLPASALPELDASARPLRRADLAADALQPDALAGILADAGYLRGREREFSGKTRTFDHVVARTLVFARPGGADRYLGWLAGHGKDILGRAERMRLALPGESGVVFTLARCGTCKKELPTFLAGWRRGSTVLTLLAAGSGANPRRFSSLVRTHDQVVR